MADVTIPGPRTEVRQYRRHMRSAHYPVRYTAACLRGWARRLMQQAYCILFRGERMLYVFCIADTYASVYCHPPYETWELKP